MLELVLFLLLLNFDAFLTGLAFGIAGVCITLAACLLVAAISALFFGSSMLMGTQLMVHFPFAILNGLSVFFLLIFTIFLISKYCGKSSRSSLAGLWKQPENLDNNADKQISAKEAATLGIALALDSLGGGLAFGLLQTNIILYSLLSALFCLTLLLSSNMLGQYIINNLHK